MAKRSDLGRVSQAAIAAIPQMPPNPVKWAEAEVYIPTSARSARFDISITPWIRDLLMRLIDGITRTITFVKPVQSGGSTFGEIAILYWIVWSRGFIQYNWQDDVKAKDRWESRVEKLLKACPAVSRKMQGLARFEAVKGEIDFGNAFFRMQGAFNPNNLDSDSVKHQVNEEVHNWEPGHLQKAYGRTTAIWNYIIANISNASKKGDQLCQALDEGTRQYWEVKCPGCSNPHHEANSIYHRMRTRWDERRPDLGGLRYDAEGCRREDGSYDYNKLEGTIRFQMPCGYLVGDIPRERRPLSLSGRYSEPSNTGAHISNRSYTLEGVSIDYIPFLKFIQDKHKALYARRHGDPEPWRRYLTERECLFYDPEDIPILGRITLSSQKKNRDGLANRVARLFALDRQQGVAAKNEFPHWWLVIRDVDADGNSLLVHEGKHETDENVIAVLEDHKCDMRHGVADSGDDTTHVYLFCLKHGINAIKGGGEPFYTHQADGAKRIFSVEKPLHRMINRESVYPYVLNREGDEVPDDREPLFWIYSKPGIRERLHWLRAATKWEVPGDVSHDYQSHMEAEELVSRKIERTGEVVKEFHQLKERNDLYVCECYIAMQIEMAGLIGAEETETPNSAEEAK